jgi:hypothetical protein
MLFELRPAALAGSAGKRSASDNRMDMTVRDRFFTAVLQSRVLATILRES